MVAHATVLVVDDEFALRQLLRRYLERDGMAVVDGEGRVHGMQALRVVDASIMPIITTGNLNAPTIMIGEKGADHVLGRGLLPPSNAPYYVAPDWQTAQR